MSLEKDITGIQLLLEDVFKSADKGDLRQRRLKELSTFTDFKGEGWYTIFMQPDQDEGDVNYIWEEDGRLLAGNYNPATGYKEVRFGVDKRWKLVPKDMSESINEDVFKSATDEDLEKRMDGGKIFRCADGTTMVFSDITTVETISYSQLTEEERDDFSYDMADLGTFFRYNGEIFDMGDFMQVEESGYLYEAGWEAYETSTHSSAYVTRMNEDGDLEVAHMWVR